jgi:2-desacetyl-2-hydroxyethyl bacteriochlorophyllide A dehydrogenase
MLSVVCVKPGELVLEERAEPSLVPGVVKVRIRRVGICGTDYHIYEGSHPFLTYPRVMGHEISGEIAEVNPGAQFSVGDRVIINPYLPCGTCIACRKNKPNCCVNVSVLGVHTDGGMCEYLNVPEAQLYAANDLSLTQAAMVEFLSIGAHAVRRGEIQASDRVLVIGAGPIGLGAAIFAQIAGATVAILDVNEARVKQAAALVKNAVAYQLDSQVEKKLSDFTQGDMFDVVLDATGNARAMETSIRYVAYGGSCVYISVVKDKICFDDPYFHAREMRLIGSRNATKMDFEHVIDSIKKGLIPMDQLNSHTADLAELPEKIPEWINNPSHLIKAVVVAGGE